ncbi:MAG: TonB family protein [Chthonomonadaceae bacterium]|nr:TonB family protein [Chthonomonadaceae bacterium]
MEHFMVDLLVRGGVLCLLTAMALLLLRRAAAAYRHLICVLALGGLLSLPLAQRLLPPLQVLKPHSAPTPARITLPIEEPDRFPATHSNAALPSSQEMPSPQIVPSEATPLRPPGQVPIAPIATPVYPASHPFRNVPAVLTAIWGMGAFALLIRLMAALLRLRRLEASSRQTMLGSVPVLVSERVDTPLTWGIRRRLILMPAALLSGDPAVCESALRHEQAHIARLDWVWNLLSEIVCAFCWFQPGVWWLRRRMRLESERACDDRVLLSGIAGPDYAAHLLQILRSVRTSEVAPAMAHSGRMEERMQHILDTDRPRRTQTKWLAVSAPFALALLSLAALRVSARPAEAKPVTDQDATVLESGRSTMPSQPSRSPLPAAESGAPNPAGVPFPQLPPISANGEVSAIPSGAPMAMAQPGEAPFQNNAPASEAPLAGSQASFEHVVWGDIVDGLQPGFLRTTPEGANNRRVPSNAKVTYRVLVRNNTRRDRVVEVACQDFTGMSPYLIPDSDIRKALSGSKIPDDYRAGGVYGDMLRSDEREVFPAYPVKIAPGEAVILPEVLSLYIGDADKQHYPRIEQIKPGRHWIVQPVMVRALTPEEAAEAMAGEKKIKLTLVSRDGKPGILFTTWRAVDPGSRKLYARIPLEFGTLHADNTPTNNPIASSKKVKGFPLQTGTAPGAPNLPAGAASAAASAPRSAPAAPVGTVIWMPPYPVRPVGTYLPAAPVDTVVWGDIVDGLQPGFLRTTPENPDNRQVPLNSQVTYQVLVRNATRRERAVEVQCKDFFEMSPYLIPDSDIRKALSGSKIPDDYRVSGVTDLAVAFLGVAVKLAPGEAVILPEVLHLYIGDGDKQNYPRIEQIKPGKNWIVQPVMVRSLSPEEAAEDLASATSPYGNGIQLTVLGRDGIPTKKLGARRGCRPGSKKLYAKIQLQVATVAAANLPAEKPVQWGETLEGFQLGARIAQDGTVFHAGDVIKFQPFGRNLSGKDINLTVGNYWKVNYKIQVQTLDGKPVYMERDPYNRAMLVAGYLGYPLGNGVTQEISEARLKIIRPTVVRTAGVDPEANDGWVEAIPFKPGRYRVRLLSWGVFGTRKPEPASGWIPIEVE